MAVWSYTPQDVFSDALTASMRFNIVSPAGGVVGIDADSTIRRFTLAYGIVTSAEAQGMRQFFIARNGSFEAFTFNHPNGLTYNVRFAPTLNLSLFTPIFFQTGGSLIFEVA